jgi:hypothetical protein
MASSEIILRLFTLIPIAEKERTASEHVLDQGLIIVQVICRVLQGIYFSLRVEG